VRWRQLIYGFYPQAEYWRAILAFVLLLVALFYGLYEKAPGRKYGLWFVCAFPFIAYGLLYGGFGGLEYVESPKWGGLLLTLAMGVTGIAVSIPFGIVLALGRRSKLPAISMLCTVFIEFIRGVPLVTLLFFGNVMLPLFLPEGMNIDIGGTLSEEQASSAKFGLDFGIYTDTHASDMPFGEGTFYWGGAAGTWFWIDPENDLFFIAMIQLFDQRDPDPTNFWEISAQHVYDALDAGALSGNPDGP